VHLRGIVSPLLGTEAVGSPVVRRALAAPAHTVRQEGGGQRRGRRGEEAPSRDLRRGAHPRPPPAAPPIAPSSTPRGERHGLPSNASAGTRAIPGSAGARSSGGETPAGHGTFAHAELLTDPAPAALRQHLPRHAERRER